MNRTRKILLIVVGVLVLAAIGTYIWFNRSSADVATSAPADGITNLDKANENDLSNIKLATSVTSDGGIMVPVPNLAIGAYGDTSFGKSIDVYQGQSVTLIWQPRYADICNPSGNWAIQPGVRYASGGSIGLKLDKVGTYSFTMNCASGTVGTPNRRIARETVTAEVQEDFLRFQLSENPDGTGGIPGNGWDYGIMTQKDIASWYMASSTNSCYKTGDWSGTFHLRQSADGSYWRESSWGQSDFDGSKMQLKTYTFVAVCANHIGGMMTASITIRVTDGKPEIMLSGRKVGDTIWIHTPGLFVKATDKFQIRAQSMNSDKCTTVNWSAGINSSTYEYIATLGPITKTTSYGITCTNKYGSTTFVPPFGVSVAP